MVTTDWQVDVEKVVIEVERKIGEARSDPKAIVPTELLLKIKKAFEQLQKAQPVLQKSA